MTYEEERWLKERAEIDAKAYFDEQERREREARRKEYEAEREAARRRAAKKAREEKERKLQEKRSKPEWQLASSLLYSSLRDSAREWQTAYARAVKYQSLMHAGSDYFSLVVKDPNTSAISTMMVDVKLGELIHEKDTDALQLITLGDKKVLLTNQCEVLGLENYKKIGKDIFCQIVGSRENLYLNEAQRWFGKTNTSNIVRILIDKPNAYSERAYFEDSVLGGVYAGPDGLVWLREDGKAEVVEKSQWLEDKSWWGKKNEHLTISPLICMVAGGKGFWFTLRRGGIIAWFGDKNSRPPMPPKTTGEYVSIAAGDRHFVCLTKDGRVLATGDNDNGQCNVDNWPACVAIAAGPDYTVAVTQTGDVISTNSKITNAFKLAASYFIPMWGEKTKELQCALNKKYLKECQDSEEHLQKKALQLDKIKEKLEGLKQTPVQAVWDGFFNPILRFFLGFSSVLMALAGSGGLLVVLALLARENFDDTRYYSSLAGIVALALLGLFTGVLKWILKTAWKISVWIWDKVIGRFLRILVAWSVFPGIIVSYLLFWSERGQGALITCGLLITVWFFWHSPLGYFRRRRKLKSKIPQAESEAKEYWRVREQCDQLPAVDYLLHSYEYEIEEKDVDALAKYLLKHDYVK